MCDLHSYVIVMSLESLFLCNTLFLIVVTTFILLDHINHPQTSGCTQHALLYCKIVLVLLFAIELIIIPVKPPTCVPGWARSWLIGFYWFEDSGFGRTFITGWSGCAFVDRWWSRGIIRCLGVFRWRQCWSLRDTFKWKVVNRSQLQTAKKYEIRKSALTKVGKGDSAGSMGGFMGFLVGSGLYSGLAVGKPSFFHASPERKSNENNHEPYIWKTTCDLNSNVQPYLSRLVTL